MNQIRKKSQYNNKYFLEKKLSTKVDGRNMSHNLKPNFYETDSGIIQVALAVTALSALLVSAFENQPIIQILPLITFFLSSYAAGRLYFTFLLFKFPHLSQVISRPAGINLLIPHFLKLFGKFFFKKLRSQSKENFHTIETEFAYLCLLLAFLILWIATINWMIYSIFPNVQLPIP